MIPCLASASATMSMATSSGTWAPRRVAKTASRLELVMGELEGFSSEFIGTLAREGRV